MSWSKPANGLSRCQYLLAFRIFGGTIRLRTKTVMNNTIRLAGRRFKLLHVAFAVAAVVLVSALLAYLIATNDSGSVSPNGQNVEASELVAAPDEYKNFGINFVGKVFVAEGKVGEQALQIYSDIENFDGNIVVYNYSSVTYSEGDFVQVTGTVYDVSEGENAFGAKLTLPVVIADRIEKINPDQAIAPALRTAKVEQSKKLGNLTVTLSRVEYAESETRLYLSFDNKTSDDYEFYSFNSTLIQDRSSLKEKSVYDRGEDATDSRIPTGTLQDFKLYYGQIKQDVPATFTVEVMNQSSYESAKLNFTFK